MTLFAPSNSDIIAFKKRLNGNPVMDAVISYIQHTNKEYSVAVFNNHISLFPMYSFWNGVDPQLSFFDGGYIKVFYFTEYGMDNIPHLSYQEAVSDVLKLQLQKSYRTALEVRPYVQIDVYDRWDGYTKKVDTKCRFRKLGDLVKPYCYTIDAKFHAKTSNSKSKYRSW